MLAQCNIIHLCTWQVMVQPGVVILLYSFSSAKFSRDHSYWLAIGTSNKSDEGEAATENKEERSLHGDQTEDVNVLKVKERAWEEYYVLTLVREDVRHMILNLE